MTQNVTHTSLFKKQKIRATADPFLTEKHLFCVVLYISNGERERLPESFQ